MLDSIHKMFLVGVGLATMTKEKIDEHIKELVEKGKLTEKEGREMADDMLKKSKQAAEDLEKQVEKLVQRALGKLQMPSKKEVEELAARIEKLEVKKTE